MPLRIYLAGPEVFLAESREIGAAKRALCADAGFEGLYPGEMAVLAPDSPSAAARAIFEHCLRAMHRADIIIANLTPWRGPSADVGTAFELGFMQAASKPSFAYTNDANGMLDRMRLLDPGVRHDPSRAGWVDRDGLLVETFGCGDNLMLEMSLTAPVVRRDVPLERRYVDLEGFRACLVLARQAA